MKFTVIPWVFEFNAFDSFVYDITMHHLSSDGLPKLLPKFVVEDSNGNFIVRLTDDTVETIAGFGALATKYSSIIHSFISKELL